MGPTSTSHRQGRAPSRRVVSAGGLHRHDAHRDKPGRRPLLQPARDGRAVNQGRQGSRPLDPPLLPPLPSQRGPPAARGHRLQPWQPATPAGLARRHPLVPDEPATAALQDRRAPHPPCPVLHAAACGELLDTAPVPPDYRPHRATRVAPDGIQRSASRRRIDVGGSVPALVVTSDKASADARSAALAPQERAVSPDCEWTASAVRLFCRQSPGWSVEKMGPNHKSRLTTTLFRQILRRIKRTRGHPTWSRKRDSEGVKDGRMDRRRPAH